ncbi:DNA-directed RNA polymerase subunit L [Candidatus Woesearchaeota archaeon]|nr:DNA-directed RNA polymerase subunit L [Candidatus Woesearchaeota archaeon]
MEIKIISMDKTSMKIELIGEDHTFANALRNELWANKSVRIAGYNIEHPLVSSPVLMINCDGKEDPKKILLKTVESLREKNNELISKLKKL